MKKIIILFLFLMLSGCAGSGEEYKCTIGGKDALVKLDGGTITSYVIDGKKVSKQEIDEINGLYLTGATNNEEGLNLLNKYLQNQNGYCE